VFEQEDLEEGQVSPKHALKGFLEATHGLKCQYMVPLYTNLASKVSSSQLRDVKETHETRNQALSS